MQTNKAAYYFWHILESDIKTPVANHVKNAFHMCGYSNAVTFKTIDEKDINAVESFVKNELSQHFGPLQQEVDLSEEDKPHFFGVYISNPMNFVFLRGERKMINALADHIRFVEAGPEGLAHFQLNVNGIDKIKIHWKGTFQSKIGMHFGEKKQIAQKKKVITKNSVEDLKIDLFDKFQKFIRQNYTEMASEISPNLVEIKIVCNSSIEAKVHCVICFQLGEIKKIKIYCQNSHSSQSWIFSNLRKHMDNHSEDISVGCTKRVALDAPNQQDGSFIEDGGENNVGKTADGEISSSDEGTGLQYEDDMFTQLTVQCLKMKNAIFMHKDSKENFSFNLGIDVAGTISVTKMKPDGNCLFSALAHQLFYLKVNSMEHQRATLDLRQKSAAYIKENMALFAHDIKGRVLDRKPEIQDIDIASSILVNQLLPQPGFWGGFESLKAISILHKINILIFCEDAHYYFATKFNVGHERSVFLAFRDANIEQITTTNYSKNRKNASSKNHYDSVVEVVPSLISECVKYCAEVLAKNECKIDSNSVISLNDSV